MKATHSAIRNSKARRFINAIAGGIASRLPEVEKIILFGSHAYGHPTSDSDVDLFILMRTRLRPCERVVSISRLFDIYPVGVDFVIRTPEEVRKQLNDFDPFLEDVFNRGYVLYAKKERKSQKLDI